ncbi:ParA family protein [Thermodesulforhabdus norvegica]|uniref:Chromosome segregation ATPase n=1 Tax=Thermodesulforhabdus norvegica TaxID=39841 RepID=A0A1I4RAG1_9BACT|nr:ParA family protein [Thermodesulforhabdus norvegica]SFM49262.1 chromosome segregation ATPase [Thermodesulforhabdus norvegica]
MAEQKAYVVAVVNQKGGVGKTTTAVNLSVCVAEMGHSVILIDGDPQANASSGLGVRLSSGSRSFLSFLQEDGGLPPLVQPIEKLPFWLLPSHASLASFEWSKHDSVFLLANRMPLLKSRCSYVFIDCPPSLGILTLNALVSADAVIIPIQCEYYALEGLSLLLETIRNVRLRWNPTLTVDGIVFTMFDRRNRLAHQVIREVRRHSPFHTYDPPIPRNVRLSEAPSHGLPVILYDPSCAGSRAYRKLAQAFVEKPRSKK